VTGSSARRWASPAIADSEFKSLLATADNFGSEVCCFRRLQRLDQPQENFPVSSFLEICEVPELEHEK
jgi:hypothetical protein